MLGGSITQVLIPLAWFIVAFRERSFTFPTALFFTGISCIDVSIYIKDAQAKILPLIGGKHDWGTVLRKYTIVEWGEPLGEFIFWMGVLTCISAICWGIYKIFWE